MRTQRTLDEMRLEAQERVQKRVRRYYRQFLLNRADVPDEDGDEMEDLTEAENGEEKAPDLYSQGR